MKTQYRFMSRWQDFLFIGLLLLAIGLFVYARVGGVRVQTQDGIVMRRATPSIIFMDERLDVELRATGSTLPRCDLPPSSANPVYAILVLDTSGSMAGAPIEDAKTAATEFVDLLDMDIDRVGLIQFNDAARTLESFSNSRDSVVRGINRLYAGNATNMGEGLTQAYQTIQETPIPPNAVRVLLLLSDGIPNVGPDPQAVALQIRNAGFQIVAVALGQADTNYLASLVTDPNEDILSAGTSVELVESFGRIAQRFVNVLATDVRVREIYNAEAFSIVPFSARGADSSQTEIVSWAWGFLGDRGRNTGYQLRPRRMGVVQVVTTPGDMSLVDCTGQTLVQSLPAGPTILVLFPLWVLAILGGLAFLWLIYRLIEEIRFGKIPVSVDPPSAPKKTFVPPMSRPSNKRSPTGHWHGKKDI